jgi:hypothetical protein
MIMTFDAWERIADGISDRQVVALEQAVIRIPPLLRRLGMKCPGGERGENS